MISSNIRTLHEPIPSTDFTNAAQELTSSKTNGKVTKKEWKGVDMIYDVLAHEKNYIKRPKIIKKTIKVQSECSWIAK